MLTEDLKKSRNARRRQKLRERQKEERRKSLEAEVTPAQGGKIDKQQTPERENQQLQGQQGNKPGGRPRRGTQRNSPSPSKENRDQQKQEEDKGKASPRRTPSPTKHNQPPGGVNVDPSGGNTRRKGPRPRSRSGRGAKSVTVSLGESEKEKVKKAEVSASLKDKINPKSAEVSLTEVGEVNLEVNNVKTEVEKDSTNQVEQKMATDGIDSEGQPLPQRKPRPERHQATKDSNANVADTTQVVMNGEVKINGEVNGNISE